MAMLLVFVGFQWFQFNHYHHASITPSSNSKNTQLYQKCEVCEFVLGKTNNGIIHTSLTAPIPLAFNLSKYTFLPYQLGKANTFSLNIDNKGPPAC